VYCPRIGGRYAAVVVSAQARPSAPDPSARTFQRVAPPSGGDSRPRQPAADEVDDGALGTGDLLVAVG